MSSVSKADGQKKLSLILSEKRKKDPLGLLRAQRNGTLNEYLREDLAKYGLAVAGVAPIGGAGASAAASKAGKASEPKTAGGAPSSSAVSASQRQASRLSPETLKSSSSPASVIKHSGGTRPLDSNWQQSSESTPSKASTSSSSSETPAASRPVPRKLDASRFGTFGGGTQEEAHSKGLAHSPAKNGNSSESGEKSVGDRTEKVVAPTSTTTSLEGRSIKNGQVDKQHPSAHDSTPSTSAGNAGAKPSAVSSIGGIAEKFGGGIKLGGSSGSVGKGGATLGGVGSLGNRSASGRIAELARRFEKNSSSE